MRRIAPQMVDELYTNKFSTTLKYCNPLRTYQHSLAAIDQFAKETHDVERTLPIKTGSRFIQKQQCRLGNELNAQGHAFALLNAKSRSRHCGLLVSLSSGIETKQTYLR